MKFPQPIPVTAIARRIGAEISGDDTLMATGINEIHKVETGDVTFVDVPKYFKKSLESPASIIILNEKTECPSGKALLICDNPFEAYNNLVLEYRPFQPLGEQIHPSAVIHPSAIIEPHVFVGPHVRIGAHSYIQANVYIAEHSIIGEHVHIQSGSIIGTSAFYYKRYDNGYKKWRSGGRVVIENHVDIGAGCTINKGVSGDTLIGSGTKLDCQVHIGHGVVVGKNCLFAAQVGIGGKTIIGDGVVIYGQAGVAPRVHIGDKAVISAKSGVAKSLEGNKTYFGAPAMEIRKYYRLEAAIRKLPELIRKWKG